MTARDLAAVTQALAAAGHEVPGPVLTHGAYRPAVLHGGLVFTSGQIPVRDGRPVYTGRVGRGGLPTDEAAQVAGLCASAAIAAAFAAAGENAALEPVKMVVFVAAEDDFTDLPTVANGASEVLSAAFDAVPARSAVGVRTLPLGVPVEVELIFAALSETAQ